VSAATGVEPVAWPEDAVEVGRIVGAWGVKGGIKVKPFSADPQALFSTKRWYLAGPAGVRPTTPKAAQAQGSRGSRGTPGSSPLLLRIVQAREQGEHVVATADDLVDRTAAEQLAGARVFVSRASFPTPAPDEFYWVDLIGLAVHNREGLKLGTVVGLIETGPTCVLRIEPPAQADTQAAKAEADECLIPFVAAYVDRVDIAGRCVFVDWQPDF
jgi:16S rRNA processing protein RimM